MKLFNNGAIFLSLLMALFLFSCDDDSSSEPTTGDPVATFQFSVDASDFSMVTFNNFSDNATSYSWDFGDGNSSTEKSPVHTYDASGDYTVTLTASNSNGDDTFSQTVTITNPDDALLLLTGTSSKTWKLFREGTSMSLGSDVDNPTSIWEGLTNDGKRPCLYQQEFTFNADGSYEFDDMGMMWAEYGVFNNVEGCDQNIVAESCFDATAANMVNACGEDVSAWLSGTHGFTFDASTGALTLNGMGAWIGIPKLGTAGETRVPGPSVTTKISIEEFTGYDVMLVEFIYASSYWPIRYVSYSDASLEPELETDVPTFGMDLPDVSPTEMFRSFASNDAAEWTLIDTIASGSNVTYGVDDPADASAAKVGLFNRTNAQYQELQFQTSPDKMDIQFGSMSTISIDVYLPSSNDYSTDLARQVVLGLGDVSQTEQWWTDLTQWESAADLALDEWITLTFNLNDPAYVALPGNGATPFDRSNLDMIYLGIGGSGHEVPGAFYVRNLRFQ